MVICARSKLKCGLAVLLASAFWACSPMRAGSEQPHAEYQQWVARYARSEFKGRAFDGSSNQLKLIITAVEGEDRKRNPGELFFGTEIFTFGTELATDGQVWGFSHTSMGSKGGGGGDPLPAADMKRLDELLAKLPDDAARLPPANRRMMLQALVNSRPVARVYDRANAPWAVWEILRLSRCGISSWLPEFKPQSEINARGFDHDGFLCQSPDGKILFTGMNAPLQIWEPTTHELLAEIRAPWGEVSSIAFSPDGSLAVIGGSECVCFDARTWKVARKFTEQRSEGGYYTLNFPRFMPDGRHLLLECNKPSLEIFDTTNWRRVVRLPAVPEDALQYVPSPKSKRALVRLKTGSVLLWDSATYRKIATLNANADLSQVAFSPDGSRVAVVTAKESGHPDDWSKPRIRIWKTDKGNLVHELRPFEHPAHEQVEGLAWSPDGQYVLVVTQASGFFTSRGVSVFNVKTGRHRGELTGCPTGVNGLALSPDGSEVVAGCQDGKILFWNFRDALKEIKAFEASLPRLRN